MWRSNDVLYTYAARRPYSMGGGPICYISKSTKTGSQQTNFMRGHCDLFNLALRGQVVAVVFHKTWLITTNVCQISNQGYTAWRHRGKCLRANL